jgi:uncharacterized protein (DUF1015 family)
MCRVRLEPFGEGNIYPHEETHSAAKADRLRLTRASRTNLSPIFGLYPDPDNEAQQLLENAIFGRTPLEARDDLGVVHRMWPVSDIRVIGDLAALVEPKPTYIADGHHRYETACNFRDELEREGHFGPEHPANYVLMMCVGMSDPGMVVLPTHRLFRGAAPISSDELIQRMGKSFTARVVGEGGSSAGDVWTEMEVRGDQGTVGLFTRKDNRWTLVSITESGRAELARVASEHGDDWRGLGVSVLHRLIIDTLLYASNLPKPMYVHSVQEVAEGLDRGDTIGRDATGQASSGGHFNLAALVMPATLEHIRTISGQGERMPAKSTYFYPKLLSGMVFNPLD